MRVRRGAQRRRSIIAGPRAERGAAGARGRSRPKEMSRSSPRPEARPRRLPRERRPRRSDRFSSGTDPVALGLVRESQLARWQRHRDHLAECRMLVPRGSGCFASLRELTRYFTRAKAEPELAARQSEDLQGAAAALDFASTCSMPIRRTRSKRLLQGIRQTSVNAMGFGSEGLFYVIAPASPSSRCATMCR